MLNWFRSVSGLTRVRVVCAQPERFLNLCAREGIPVREPVPVDAYTLSLELPAPDVPRAGALAARCGASLEIGRERGLPRFKRRLRRRRFALALLALAAAAVMCSSAFLWEIRVTGNDTVPTGKILRALRDCGVESGTCWLFLQSQALQSELIARMPELEWVSFQIRGSRADVIVYEATDAPEVLDNGEPVDLVASRSGIVTKITVLQGAPQIARGALVAPGQVLVSGAVEDRQGQLYPAHALGEVRARTDYAITAMLPKRAGVLRGQGRPHSRWALVFGKKRINFYQSSGIPDAECVTIYHEYVCAGPGVFRLPLAIVREELLPCDTEVRDRTESEARALLESALRETLTGLLGADGEIVSLRFTPGETDEAFVLTLRAECEQQIAAERKITE